MCDDDADIVTDFSNEKLCMTQLHSCNWIIANCSTPANLFHILRRQIALPFRKPLIIATPKSLLRLPACRSSFDDMIIGTGFHSIIPEMGPTIRCKPDTVKKLIFCSGKTYYDLVAARKERGKDNEIAISRIEQVYI